MPVIELQTIEYTKGDLAKVPQDHRIFFLTLTSLINDCQTLFKQVAVAVEDVPGNRIINQGNSAVGLLNMRLWAGRMWEGWLAISKFSGTIKSDYEPHLSPNGMAALSELRRYFPAKDNLINRIRNKVGFHADPHTIESAFQSLNDDDDMGDYLNKTIGNTLFYSCEMVHYRALSEITGIASSRDALLSVITSMNRTQLQLNSFGLGFVNAFYWRFLRDAITRAKESEPERLEEGVLRFDQMRFAFFAEMPEVN